eukprot:m.291488 g.291488  ORF g.291488 m.291488 type:complete len:51 (+) comp19976_c0_seq77:57-209(+)
MSLKLLILRHLMVVYNDTETLMSKICRATLKVLQMVLGSGTGASVYKVQL